MLESKLLSNVYKAVGKSIDSEDTKKDGGKISPLDRSVGQGKPPESERPGPGPKS